MKREDKGVKEERVKERDSGQTRVQQNGRVEKKKKHFD
tara:strand:- start:306 stop:419 length:114 start_codon:yes stop_codon:yes gene_type:complete